MIQRSHLEFFWLFVRRDLSVRYAGSTLGAVWNLIHPLVMIAIYTLIFSSLMKVKLEAAGVGVDYGALGYAVHMCAGLIPWLLFSDVLNRSAGVLIENGNFLQKVAFPPIVLFASLLFNGLVIYGTGFLGFLGIIVLCGHAPPFSALGALLVMALFGLTAMGLGLVLSGLNVFFRDTAQVLNITLQVLFWLNPIVYSKEWIPAFNPTAALDDLTLLERGGRLLMALNPFERFISAAQYLFGQAARGPTILDWVIVLVLPWLSLLVGLLLFRRMLPDVRDTL